MLSNRSNTPGGEFCSSHLVIPSHSASLVPSTRHRLFSMSLMLYLIPNFLFLLALSYVPLPKDMPTHNIMAATLSRLTVIGTVILGGLSGFGAIDTAWDFFPLFSRNPKCVSHVTLCAFHEAKQIDITLQGASDRGASAYRGSRSPARPRRSCQTAERPAESGNIKGMHPSTVVRY